MSAPTVNDLNDEITNILRDITYVHELKTETLEYYTHAAQLCVDNQISLKNKNWNTFFGGKEAIGILWFVNQARRNYFAGSLMQNIEYPIPVSSETHQRTSIMFYEMLEKLNNLKNTKLGIISTKKEGAKENRYLTTLLVHAGIPDSSQDSLIENILIRYRNGSWEGSEILGIWAKREEHPLGKYISRYMSYSHEHASSLVSGILDYLDGTESEHSLSLPQQFKAKIIELAAKPNARKQAKFSRPEVYVDINCLEYGLVVEIDGIHKPDTWKHEGGNQYTLEPEEGWLYCQNNGLEDNVRLIEPTAAHDEKPILLLNEYGRVLPKSFKPTSQTYHIIAPDGYVPLGEYRTLDNLSGRWCGYQLLEAKVVTNQPITICSPCGEKIFLSKKSQPTKMSITGPQLEDVYYAKNYPVYTGPVTFTVSEGETISLTFEDGKTIYVDQTETLTFQRGSVKVTSPNHQYQEQYFYYLPAGEVRLSSYLTTRNSVVSGELLSEGLVVDQSMSPTFLHFTTADLYMHPRRIGWKLNGASTYKTEIIKLTSVDIWDNHLLIAGLPQGTGWRLMDTLRGKVICEQWLSDKTQDVFSLAKLYDNSTVYPSIELQLYNENGEFLPLASRVHDHVSLGLKWYNEGRTLRVALTQDYHLMRKWEIQNSLGTTIGSADTNIIHLPEETKGLWNIIVYGENKQKYITFTVNSSQAAQKHKNTQYYWENKPNV